MRKTGPKNHTGESTGRPHDTSRPNTTNTHHLFRGRRPGVTTSTKLRIARSRTSHGRRACWEESLVWFLQQLRNIIGSPPGLAIHTDACKGLESAVEIVFPGVEHRNVCDIWRKISKRNSKVEFMMRIYGQHHTHAVRGSMSTI